MAVFSDLRVDPSLLSSRIHLSRERVRKSEKERKRERKRAPIDVPIQQVQERGEDAGHSTRISGNPTTTTAFEDGGGDKIRGASRGIPSRGLDREIAPRCRRKMHNSDIPTVEKERKRRDGMNFGRKRRRVDDYFFFSFCYDWNLFRIKIER